MQISDVHELGNFQTLTYRAGACDLRGGNGGLLSGPLTITNSDMPAGGDVSAGCGDGFDIPCTGEPPLISSDAGDIEETAESLDESVVRGTDDTVRGGRGGGTGRTDGEAASAERLSGATSALRSSVSARRGVDRLSEPCS